jgi:soluble lytic murein transglycosylase-like protein
MPEFDPGTSGLLSPGSINLMAQPLMNLLSELPTNYRNAQLDQMSVEQAQRVQKFNELLASGAFNLPGGGIDFQKALRFAPNIQEAVRLAPEAERQTFDRQIMGGAPSGPPAGADRSGVGAQVAQYAQQYGPQYGVSPDLIQRVAWQESRYNPRDVSPAGAQGVMQFMPSTARDYSVNPWSVESSVRGGAQYLGDLMRRYNNNEGLALAAYNWGESRVDNWLKNGANPRLMPRETQNYVQSITAQPISAWVSGAAMRPTGAPAPRTAGSERGAVFAGATPPVSTAAAERTRPPGASQLDAQGNEIVDRSGGVPGYPATALPQPERPRVGDRTPPQLTEESLLRSVAGRTPSGYIESEFAQLPPSGGAVTAPASGTAQRQPPSRVAQQPWPTEQQADMSWPTAPTGDRQPTQPLVPHTPTPGFAANDWQRAISYYERMAAVAPTAQQSRYYQNLAKQVRDEHTPIMMRPGEILVDPRTGQQIATPGAGYAGETAALLDADAQHYRLTGQYPPSMGRGIQGQQQATAIRERAVQLEIQSGGDPANWSNRWVDWKVQQAAQTAGARTGATREANLQLILNATNAAIPAALEQSKKVWRTGFVPLNKIIQAGQIITSDPELGAFGMANLQLAEHWARAMNPTGVMRESDRDKALSFLSTADSITTYARKVQQLKTQIERELRAVRRGESGEAPEPGGDTSGASGAGGQWTTLPNGVRIREVK